MCKMKVFKVIVMNEHRPKFTGHNILAKDEDDATRIQKKCKIGNPIGGNSKVIRVFENNYIRGMVWKEEDFNV